MTENWRGVQRVAKRGIAGTIFVLLLLGGSAAVFSALAAGVNALTAVDESASQSTGYNSGGTSPAVSYSNQVSQGNTITTGQGVSASNSRAASNSAQASFATTQLDFADRLNYSLQHMHSPVSGAIDTGGVVLGDRLSRSFGGFMSNLLQFLFVEQADNSVSAASTSGPHG